MPDNIPASEAESKAAPFDEVEVKTFTFEPDPSADLQPNEFAGYVAVTGNVDGHGDVILPGAFKSVIPDFVQNGHIYLNHDWMQGGEPIGKPIEAHEDAKGLYLKGHISETTKGKDTLTLLRDGVIKKMSIGYKPKSPRYLSDAEGKSILGETGYRKALDSLPANRTKIRAHGDFKSLFDGSVVTIPSNTQANVLAVKAGAPAALTFDDHFAAVRDANAEMQTRFADLVELRSADGRTLSDTKRAQLTTLRDQAAAMLAGYDEVLAALPPSGAEAKARDAEAEAKRQTLADEAQRELIRYLELEARLSGNL